MVTKWRDSRPKTTPLSLLFWAGFGLLCLAFFLLIPPIPQDLSYHNFADSRKVLGTPNFADVTSNIIFILVGALGIWETRRQSHSMLPYEPKFWFIFFIGTFLVGLGSGYYHLHPNNKTLIWDRLPMTLGFMSLFGFVVFDRLSQWQGRVLLPIFLILGIMSVFYWDYTEGLGAGDLRPYAIVQFGPFFFILFLFSMLPSHYTGGMYFARIFAWYGLAKVFEYFDHGVFQLTLESISGHTLKHVASAIACYEVVRYLRYRQRYLE